MKGILLFAAMTIFALEACHKTENSTCSNTINIYDNEAVYRICGYSEFAHETDHGARQTLSSGVEAVVHEEKMIDSTSIGFQAGPSYPVSLAWFVTRGNGRTGIYRIRPEDLYATVYEERFAGGQNWRCTSGTVNVTRYGADNVSGTFVIMLCYGSANKVVSGDFEFKEPVFR